MKMTPSHPITEQKPMPVLGNRRGMALVWILVTMVLMAAVGAAMVSFYGATTATRQQGALIHQARLMAESGRRFFETEYREINNLYTAAADRERAKNQLIASDLHGKTFNPAAGESNRFTLDFTSYYFRAASALSAGSTLSLRFVGSGGFDPTGFSSGKFRIEGATTLYSYSSSPSVSGSGDSAVYTYSVSPSIPSTKVFTGVYPVVSSSYSGVSENGTLTLSSGRGGLFPEENGMFLVEKEKIRQNLPVATTVPYRYRYRSGDQLVNVTKGPRQGSFTAIDAASPGNVEVAKFVQLSSTGFFESEVSAESLYQLSIPSPTSTPGVVSYWNFDDTGTPATAADDYGTADGTIQGTDVTYTTTDVAAGTGAVDFGGTGYIETTFAPATELGSNQPFTVSLWAKPDTVTDFFKIQILVGSGDFGGVDRFYLGILTLFGSTNWIWGYGTQSDFLDSYGTLPDVDFGTWQHVTFQYDGTNIKLFKNGRQAYSTTYLGTGAVSSVNVVLGGLPTTSSGILYKYSGLMDEVAIFNEALGFCKTNAIFEAATAPPCNDACDAALYYDFDGNANDVSGTARNGTPAPVYNGTVSGATLTEDRCTYDDRAYYFNSSDRIDTGFNPRTVIGNLNSFTVAFWAKPGQVVSLESAFGAIDSPSSPTQRFYVYVIDGQWSWGYGNVYAPSASRPTATAGQWAHVAFVFDKKVATDLTDDEVRFYVNGTQYTYDYDSLGGSGVMPDYTAYVGARNAGGSVNATFSGSVDEVLIWTSARTAAQISTLYTTTKP